MKAFWIIAVPVCVIYISACSNNTITNSNSGELYTEIYTLSISDYNVGLYVKGSDSLTTGYNDVYFKVTKNSTVQTGGYVKLYPRIWMTPHVWHSTPVSDTFLFDNSSGFFKGYAIFNMSTTLTGLIWKSTITYHDAGGIDHIADSIATYTSYRPEKQWKYFYDSSENAKYYLTLVKPFSPARGMSDIWMIIHSSDDLEQNFEKLTDPVMHTAVYEGDSLNNSSGNTPPSAGPDGIYKGKINLPYTGTWKVCDTIYYHGHNITNLPPPMPDFLFGIQ